LPISKAEEVPPRRFGACLAALVAGSLLVLPAAASGAVRSVQAPEGPLTGAAAGDRAEVTLDWVRDNRRRLGLTAAAVDGLELADRSTSPGTRITHLRFRYLDRGIPAFDGGVRVSVDRAGRILKATGVPGVRVESDLPQGRQAARSDGAFRRSRAQQHGRRRNATAQANRAAQVRLPTLPSCGRFHGGPWRRRWNVRTIRSVFSP
jgi:hypothetical protein